MIVKKPRRLTALSFIISRLAEQRLHHRMPETEHTISNQINTPTNTPMLRWVFPCFAGIALLSIRVGSPLHTRLLQTHPLHHNIFRLPDPASQDVSLLSA